MRPVVTREVGLRDGPQRLARTRTTVGCAEPLAVRDLLDRAFAIAGDRLSCGHFHETLPPLAAEAEA
jgi:hydroxymethylglutaryl-CoA lyase